MSTQERSVSEVRDNVKQFLQSNFPQIKMHGGNATITDVNLDEGAVSINLGGACSGCGISPMTIQALKSRLPKQIPEITTVHADTGQEQSSTGMTPSFAGDTTDDSDEDTEAPF